MRYVRYISEDEVERMGWGIRCQEIARRYREVVFVVDDDSAAHVGVEDSVYIKPAPEEFQSAKHSIIEDWYNMYTYGDKERFDIWSGVWFEFCDIGDRHMQFDEQEFLSLITEDCFMED